MNGELVTHPGTLVNPDIDEVNIDGEALPAAIKKVYFLMYKPKGCVTTRNDPMAEKLCLMFWANSMRRWSPLGAWITTRRGDSSDE